MEQEEADKMLEKDRKEVLANRVQNYKTGILTKAIVSRIKAGSKQAKILTLWSLNKNLNIKALSKLKEADIDEDIFELLQKQQIYSMSYENRKDAVELLTNFKFEKDWTIDEDFLNLHTKDQLGDLMKELKIKTDTSNMSKQELVAVIMEVKIKGLVPRIMKA